MREEKRKCVKCGSSPVTDPDTKLYRFPKPGTRNAGRAELWAKYCYPDQPWSSPDFQKQLYTQHKMLCHRHFKESAFVDYPTKQLGIFASPDAEEIIIPCLEIQNTKPVAEATQPLLDIIIRPPPAVPGSNSKPQKTKSVAEATQPLLDIIIRPPPAVSGSNSKPQSTKPVAEATQPPLDIIIQPSPVVPGSNTSQNTKPVAEATQPLLEIIIQPPPVIPGSSEVIQKPVLILKKNKRLEYLKCKLYLQKITTLQRTLGRMKNKELLHKLLALSKNISPSFALLLQSQIKNCKTSPKLRRWTTQEKITALKLYKKSPDCYRLFRSNLPIPLPSSLKALLRMFVFKDGINMHIFKIIGKFALRLNAVNNEFVLMFNEVALRKNKVFNQNEDIIGGFEDHGELENTPQPDYAIPYALVFMIAGITKKIKQPVAYYLSDSLFTADRLATLIKEVLGQCYDHGINVSATVCDMETVNWRALNILGASISSPYFTYDSHEVVAIIDPPHLIKCFRDQFLEYDIDWPIDISNERAGTGIAKWSHIVQFYEIDNANPNNAFAPLLKLEHLCPNSKQKNRVNLAVQLLSHSVSSGMYARIGKGLSVSAIVTADLIFKMDKIIDTLNSDTTDLRRGKPYSTNLRDSTPHFTLIEDMKKRFLSMKFVGAKHTSALQVGWIWTLNGIERLWHTLRQRHPSLRSVATRRLQLDPLENLFACIRTNYGSNCDPTTAQFVDALKITLLTNISHVGVSNCEIDNYENIINNFRLYLNSKDVGEGLDVGTSSSLFGQVSDDNRKIKNRRCKNLRTYKRVNSIPIP